MRRFHLPPSQHGFHVLASTPRSQAATMVTEPGHREGGPANYHLADQWMYVVAGRGTARFGDRALPLEPGVLLLIEAGEEHEIVSEGDEPLRTVNVYSPPWWTSDGEPLPGPDRR